jgi:hypothetical protein
MTKKSLPSLQRHFQRLQSLEVERSQWLFAVRASMRVQAKQTVQSVAVVVHHRCGARWGPANPAHCLSQVNDMSCKLLLAHTWTAVHEHQWGSRPCLVSADWPVVRLLLMSEHDTMPFAAAPASSRPLLQARRPRPSDQHPTRLLPPGPP